MSGYPSLFGLGHVPPVVEKSQFAECRVCFGLSNDTLRVNLPKGLRLLLKKYIIEDFSPAGDTSLVSPFPASPSPAYSGGSAHC